MNLQRDPIRLYDDRTWDCDAGRKDAPNLTWKDGIWLWIFIGLFIWSEISEFFFGPDKLPKSDGPNPNRPGI